MAESSTTSGIRDALKVWGGAGLLVIIGLAVAYQFVEPAPPDTLVLATGNEQGAYHRFGQRYREALSEYGIDVELLTTAGSVENLERLRAGTADIAFVQGGVIGEESDGLAGIGSLYFEPLWLFHRIGVPDGTGVERLTDLVGKRIQVGAEGSGTRAVALPLLSANGVNESNSTLVGLTDSEAAPQLRDGPLDAAFLVTAPSSTAIGTLMKAEGKTLQLFDATRALAYARTFPYLSHVVLPEGGLDFVANIPDRPINMIAPAATLISTDTLHPAIVPLFIIAAEQIHGEGDLLAAPGTFPSPRRLDVPPSTAATTYYKNGLSFLYRVLPFPIAASLDRLEIMLLPLITLLFPLFKVAGPIYTWSIRSKIYRWYGVLRTVESQFETGDKSDSDVAGHLDELARVEREINAVTVPASYMEELYNLRMHLALVQASVGRKG
jgi:TRAP transporter TAXI family solute receptor